MIQLAITSIIHTRLFNKISILRFILIGCFCGLLLLLQFWVYHRFGMIRNFYILSVFNLSTKYNRVQSVQGWLVSYRVLPEFFFSSMEYLFEVTLLTWNTHTDDSPSSNWIWCCSLHCLHHSAHSGIQEENRWKWQRWQTGNW